MEYQVVNNVQFACGPQGCAHVRRKALTFDKDPSDPSEKAEQIEARLMDAFEHRDTDALFNLCSEGHDNEYIKLKGMFPLLAAIREDWPEGCQTILLFNPEIKQFYVCWHDLRPFEYAHVQKLWQDMAYLYYQALIFHLNIKTIIIIINYLTPTHFLQFDYKNAHIKFAIKRTL